MKRTYLSIYLVFSVFWYAHGQKIAVEAIAGYASFQMHDLGRILHDYSSSSSFPQIVTDDFPPYFTYGANIVYQSTSFSVGMNYIYLSTGGSANYQDYSGTLGFDQLVSAHALGLLGRVQLLEFRRFTMKGSCLLSLYLTNVVFKSYVSVSGIQEEEELDLASESIVLTPALNGHYSIKGPVYVGFSVGHALGIEGKVHLPNNRNAVLLDADGNTITTDWSGWRSELSIGVSF